MLCFHLLRKEAPGKLPDTLLGEYIRRGRPGDGLSAGEIHLIALSALSGQTCYRLECREIDGQKKWYLDNGLTEKDISEHLDQTTIDTDHVLKAEPATGRAYVVSQKSFLFKQKVLIRLFLKVSEPTQL